MSFAGGELRESRLSRSRQVTGCIVLVEAMRPRKGDWSDLWPKRHHEARKVTSHRSLVTAAKHVYSTSVFDILNPWEE